MHEQPFPGWFTSSFFFPDPALSWIPLLSSWPKLSTWELSRVKIKTLHPLPLHLCCRGTYWGSGGHRLPSLGVRMPDSKTRKALLSLGRHCSLPEDPQRRMKGFYYLKTYSLSIPVYAGGDARCDNSRGTCTFPSSPLRPDDICEWLVGIRRCGKSGGHQVFLPVIWGLSVKEESWVNTHTLSW